VLDQIMAVSRQHEAEICAGLSESRHRALIDTLSRIVSEQGLAVGGHPRMSEPPKARTRRS
jgi:hypothetical protein